MTAWASSDPEELRPAIATRVPLVRSLRLRTAAAMALLAVTLVLAAGAVFAHTSIAGAREQLRAQAVSQLRATLATAAFGGVLPPQAMRDRQALPAAMQDLRPADGIVTDDDGTWMWAARAQAGGLIATRVPNTPVQQQWDGLVGTFVTSAAVAAIVAAAVSWFVAGRLTARLRGTANAVNDLIAGRPVVHAAADDEVGVLTRGIAETAAALARRLDHERGVTADVAHDLRTPLTALTSAAALLEDGEDADRVRRLVRRLRTLVDDLLRLARAQHDVAPTELRRRSLAELTERIVAGAGAGAGAGGPGPGGPGAALVRPVAVRVVRDATVEVDPDRLVPALTNLVSNAERHGGPDVEVVVDGTAVHVLDDGPGFPVALLAEGPRRFSVLSSGTGAGIGLAIVLHHAEAMGARLELENTAGGARATLRFRG